jgi:uncharacterized RDD family membrane protein YckC
MVGSAARSSPTALFGAGILIFAYWVAISDNARYDGTKPVGIFRRAVAYMTDLWIALTILPTVLAVPLLMIESSLTGSFAWEFNRTNLVPTDVLVGIPLLIISIVLINLYFAYPLTRGTQTPGCRLLGLTIIDFDEQDRVPLGRAVMRSFLAYLGAVGFLITIPLALWSRQPGVMWYDEIMDTRAAKLVPGE